MDTAKSSSPRTPSPAGQAGRGRVPSDRPRSSPRTASPAGRAGRGRRPRTTAILTHELLHLPDEPAGVGLQSVLPS